MPVYAGALTDKGPKRAQNEDSYVLLHAHNAFAVADGSGGVGDVVARCAIDAFASLYRLSTPQPHVVAAAHDELFSPRAPPSVRQRNRVVAAVRFANRAVHKLVTSSSNYKGCGTTFLAAELDDKNNNATFAWVGEACAFHFDSKNGSVRALTRPHTLVNEQLAAGLITEQEARASTFKNIITRVLGYEEHVKVDSLTTPMRAGDVFLLLSDGVWQALEETGIARVVGAWRDKSARGIHVAEGARLLVQAAHAKDMGDNATAVLIEVA